MWNFTHPLPPTCGCDGRSRLRANDDGSLWTRACWKREHHRRAIANAKQRIARRSSVQPEARSPLYRALAAAFHPESAAIRR